jgi:hypothetical protein
MIGHFRKVVSTMILEQISLMLRSNCDASWPGVVPAIHVLISRRQVLQLIKSWMSATSAGMTS